MLRESLNREKVRVKIIYFIDLWLNVLYCMGCSKMISLTPPLMLETESSIYLLNIEDCIYS